MNKIRSLLQIQFTGSLRACMRVKTLFMNSQEGKLYLDRKIFQPTNKP